MKKVNLVIIQNVFQIAAKVWSLAIFNTVRYKIMLVYFMNTYRKVFLIISRAKELYNYVKATFLQRACL